MSESWLFGGTWQEQTLRWQLVVETVFMVAFVIFFGIFLGNTFSTGVFYSMFVMSLSFTARLIGVECINSMLEEMRMRHTVGPRHLWSIMGVLLLTFFSMLTSLIHLGNIVGFAVSLKNLVKAYTVITFVLSAVHTVLFIVILCTLRRMRRPTHGVPEPPVRDDGDDEGGNNVDNGGGGDGGGGGGGAVSDDGNKGDATPQLAPPGYAHNDARIRGILVHRPPPKTE